MRAIVRKYPFTTYYLLAFAIVSLVVAWQVVYQAEWLRVHHVPFDYVGALMKGSSDFYHGTVYNNIVSIFWVAYTRYPIYWGVFVFGGAPTISAIVISLIGWGPAGLKRLLLRLKPWPSRAFRREALIAYAVITGFFFLYSLVNIGIIWKYDGVGEVLNRIGVWGLPWYLFPVTFFIGAFVDEGATQEELGWRGYALPSLLDRYGSPLLVALGLGFLWWFWHFPREVPVILTGQVKWGPWLYGQGMFIVLVVSMSVVMTFFYHRTGGSVIPGILLHAWGNFLSKDIGTYLITKTDERIYVWLAVAILLVICYGPSLGRKRYLALIGADPSRSSEGRQQARA